MDTHMDCACSTKVYAGIGYRLYRIGWVKFVRGIRGLGPVQVRAVVAILLYYIVALNDEIRSCLKIRNDGVRMDKREVAVKSVRPNMADEQWIIITICKINTFCLTTRRTRAMRIYVT